MVTNVLELVKSINEYKSSIAALNQKKKYLTDLDLINECDSQIETLEVMKQIDEIFISSNRSIPQDYFFYSYNELMYHIRHEKLNRSYSETWSSH